MPTRLCNGCNTIRDADEDFYDKPVCHTRRKSGRADGKHSHCKRCMIEKKRKLLTCAGCSVQFYRRDRNSPRLLCEPCSQVGMVCSRCKQFKPVDRFYARAVSGKKGGRYCRDGCAQLAATEWTYGFLPGTAEIVLSNMGDACMICGVIPSVPGKQRRLVVDHCHKTGVVRGILCSSCNSGLGYFRDNPDTLKNAIAYLKRARKKVRA